MAGLDNIGSGITYDYGIDNKGKMWIWDVVSKKMVYYGDKAGGGNKVISLQLGYDAKTNFKGDRSNKASTPQAPAADPDSRVTGTGVGAGGGGYSAPAKVLDSAQLASLDSYLGTIDSARDTNKQKAALKRDASKREKEEEAKREKGKYDGKKLSTLQDFGGAKTDTDINTRNTLENLLSSLSTMGLGGSRALTRQILDAANMSNRKANATQATNNQGLDSAFNDYTVGNENDVRKINDQYGFEAGEADRNWAQQRRDTLYKKADVYGAVDDTAQRQALMSQGDALNPTISNSAFVNPSYTGASREMATPELGSYIQDIAKYDTTSVGAPVGADGTTTPGNLAVKAIAVNDKDLGVKKRTEGDLGYGA